MHRDEELVQYANKLSFIHVNSDLFFNGRYLLGDFRQLWCSLGLLEEEGEGSCKGEEGGVLRISSPKVN